MSAKIKEEAPKASSTRKYVAIRRFGYEGGEANVDDVVALTSVEAKSLNKLKAIAPYVPEDEAEDK
jgi:hypothetical protein